MKFAKIGGTIASVLLPLVDMKSMTTETLPLNDGQLEKYGESPRWVKKSKKFVNQNSGDHRLS
ncbi:MAG: hypothetical protein KAJ03_12000 [Gammaproteobacteria bacterium]|nr:hypothetical protein [Gammaproteobacteria bacterium]